MWQAEEPLAREGSFPKTDLTILRLRQYPITLLQLLGLRHRLLQRSIAWQSLKLHTHRVEFGSCRFNALNCVSNRSLLARAPWTNRPLVGAVALSLLLHGVLLYAPPMQAAFHTVPLNASEWAAVVLVRSLQPWRFLCPL